jgi:hypothetical protein
MYHWSPMVVYSVLVLYIHCGSISVQVSNRTMYLDTSVVLADTCKKCRGGGICCSNSCLSPQSPTMPCILHRLKLINKLWQFIEFLCLNYQFIRFLDNKIFLILYFHFCYYCTLLIIFFRYMYPKMLIHFWCLHWEKNLKVCITYLPFKCIFWVI